MHLSICPSCHHRSRHDEFPKGAVTCPTCGAPYAPWHEADVRFALLRNWATSEGVAFDDDGPIEAEDDTRFTTFLAEGSWFVKVFSRAVMTGEEQFEFTCIRRQDPRAYMETVLAEDAEWIRDCSNGVANTTIIRNDDNTYAIETRFTDPDDVQRDTYFLFTGFTEETI